MICHAYRTCGQLPISGWRESCAACSLFCCTGNNLDVRFSIAADLVVALIRGARKQTANWCLALGKTEAGPRSAPNSAHADDNFSRLAPV